MTTVQSPDVVVLARRAFVESGRIDMGALATAAGINRSTLAATRIATGCSAR